MKHLAAFLLLTAVAWADAPVAKIAGPDKGRPGDILILDASGSAATFYDWSIDASDVQVPDDGDVRSLMETAAALRSAGFKVTAPKSDAPPVYLLLDGGQRVLLASYPGTYRVSLAVGNAEGVAQLPWRVVVAGAKPPKPDDEDDDPDPPPPPPDSGLARIAHDGVKGMLTPENRIQFILLSGVYETVANDIRDGKVATVDAALDRTKELTHTVMGEQVGAWLPVVRAIENELNRMRDAGLLDTTKVAAYERPFRDIGGGILQASGVASAIWEAK